MEHQLQAEEYVIAAKGAGMKNSTVLVRYVLRNSLFGLITVVGVNFGALISGTVVIENIFGLPGIGSLLVDSINGRDAPVVQAIVLLMAVAVIVVNLIADLLYQVLDPRIRFGHD
jgi:peptide/nickel transport system permease protein